MKEKSIPSTWKYFPIYISVFLSSAIIFFYSNEASGFFPSMDQYPLYPDSVKVGLLVTLWSVTGQA